MLPHLHHPPDNCGYNGHCDSIRILQCHQVRQFNCMSYSTSPSSSWQADAGS